MALSQTIISASPATPGTSLCNRCCSYSAVSRSTTCKDKHPCSSPQHKGREGAFSSGGETPLPLTGPIHALEERGHCLDNQNELRIFGWSSVTSLVFSKGLEEMILLLIIIWTDMKLECLSSHSFLCMIDAIYLILNLWFQDVWTIIGNLVHGRRH